MGYNSDGWDSDARKRARVYAARLGKVKVLCDRLLAIEDVLADGGVGQYNRSVLRSLAVEICREASDIAKLGLPVDGD